MVFNTTFQQYFNYIVASVLFVLEIGVQGRNHPPATDTLSHNVVSRIPLLIDTDWIVSCNSNYHTITDGTIPIPPKKNAKK